MKAFTAVAVGTLCGVTLWALTRSLFLDCLVAGAVTYFACGFLKVGEGQNETE